MAIISRRQYDHPALATAGGSALHASISNLYTVLGDDSMSRYKAFTAVANSSVGVIAHEFGLDFANLKVQIFTGTYPALTLVSDPIGTGWTVAATAGLASRSIDVTAPASGGPHTYAVLVSHESNATAFIPGLVSIGAQSFAGPKTFTGTLFGTDTTDSSSSTTGAFKTAGGLGVAKKLYVGGNFFMGSTAARNLITHFDYTDMTSSNANKGSSLYFNSAATTNGAVGVTGTAATDIWAAGKANYSFLQGASGIQFIGNVTEGGFMTAAGAWTLGASTSGFHTLQGAQAADYQVKITNTAANGSGLRIQCDNTNSTCQSWFSSATNIGNVTTAGAWTLGSTGGVTSFHTIQAQPTGDFAVKIKNTNSTAGTAYGLRITAGTNAVDSPFAVYTSNDVTQLGVCNGLGAWTLGATNANNYNAAVHTINGGLQAGGTGSGGQARYFSISANLYDTNHGGTARTTGLTGSQIILDSSTSNNAASLYINMQASASGATTTTGVITAASCTALGAWTLGPATPAAAPHTSNGIFAIGYSVASLTQTTPTSVNITNNTDVSGFFYNKQYTSGGGTTPRAAYALNANLNLLGIGTNASSDLVFGLVTYATGLMTNLGSMSQAGAWTLGPASFNGVHILNCEQLKIASTTNNSTSIKYAYGGTDKFISYYYNVDGSMRMSNAAGTDFSICSSAGAWTFPTNTLHTFGTNTGGSDTRFLTQTSTGNYVSYEASINAAQEFLIGTGTTFNTGSATTAMQIRTQTRALNISLNGGTDIHLSGTTAGAWTLGPDSGYTIVHKSFGTWDHKTAASVGVGAIYRSAAALTSGQSHEAVQIYDNTTYKGGFGVAKTTNTSNQAGFLALVTNDGTVCYLWCDDTGRLRISTTQANTGGQATGTVVGTQT